MGRDRLIAVVADGAGSAANGAEGAATAVNAVLAAVAATKRFPSRTAGSATWQAFMRALFKVARDAVAVVAHSADKTARDYATTLLVVIAYPKHIISASVGDCIAVAREADHTLRVVNQCHRGEFANETLFLTELHAMDRVNVSTESWTGAGFALISDGLEGLAIDPRGPTPHPGFFTPFLDMIALHPEADCERWLREFLQSDSIARRTFDDLSLLAAGVVQPSRRSARPRRSERHAQ